MNENFYETGSTQPPKSRIYIVFFLVLLIFVGGIITALGILNVKLWGAFSPDKEESVSLRFTRKDNSTVANFASPQITGSASSAGLGVETETISAFARSYYRLPKGVYIPNVPAGSNAAAAGIHPGDVLLSINGDRITNTETLQTLLRRYKAGEQVTLTLYRKGQKLSVALTLIEEN